MDFSSMHLSSHFVNRGKRCKFCGKEQCNLTARYVEKYLLFKSVMWYHVLMPLNPCIGKQWASITYSAAPYHSRFLRFLSCATPAFSFPGSGIPVDTVCLLFCNISYFALFPFQLLYLMGFVFTPPVLPNSWCVCWVSFSEIPTLRSHSSVVITISEPTTAYFFFFLTCHFTFIYIWFCLPYFLVSWSSSRAYQLGLCLYSMQ